MTLRAIVLTACVALLAGACHSATTHPAAAPASGPAPVTLEQECNTSWPKPVPDVTGRLMDQALNGSLFCFNVATAAVGGRDILHAIATPATDYRISGVSPPAGTSVDLGAPINVALDPLDPSAPPAFRPCDWVTASDATRFMGTPSVTATPHGDLAGSIDQTCDYAAPGHLVISELMLAGSVPVDPRATFEMTIANGHGSDVAGLPARGYCTGNTVIPVLVVLLPGDRLYEAADDSCDVLRQFAQAAIARIG